MVRTLFLLLLALSLPPASAQTVPAGWKVLKDSKNSCQIAVPPDWDPWAENTAAAIYQDPTRAIAVVTSQPGQPFKPLPESIQKLLGIRREKMFENSAKLIFYQDKTSRNSDDQNAYSASVPRSGGTCSCRVAFVPGIPEETVRKIALSLAPVPE